MIEIDGKYQITKDQYNWILKEAYEGTDRKGNPKTQYKASYYATMRQACNAIIDRELSASASIEDALNVISRAEEMLITRIEDKNG